eukprot:CAMPEP_0202692836 /NCGR_PEP_ID=MMETSP1385-20130828/7119_1 /ASSEMBLY_ACC=CAM_ASM_000861 /TAXON_ID=933848 /ORGANISM="Elphidium margaritaceum" /LENGTH=266 /DNA_ID=CAMNT_0049348433 /DNA_START=26 /DNA_END=826 /DNA_ORIENTATION=-
MDPFGLFTSSTPKTDSHRKARSSSSTKSQSHTTASSRRKSRFESSSSEDEYTSYNTSRSRSMMHQSESNASHTNSSSSSDIDIAQMDDFKPLLASAKRQKHNRNNSRTRTIPLANMSQKKSKTMSNLHSHKAKAAQKKMDKTVTSIDDFQNEIHSLRAMNKQYAHSDTNLMSQVQHENKEQDAVLDDMATVLARLQVMSQDIGNEIVDQDEMLKETTEAADTVYDRMKRVDHKMTELMRNSGLSPCKMIAILSCMVLTLILLIVLA